MNLYEKKVKDVKKTSLLLFEVDLQKKVLLVGLEDVPEKCPIEIYLYFKTKPLQILTMQDLEGWGYWPVIELSKLERVLIQSQEEGEILE